jgi:hypothetical protein
MMKQHFLRLVVSQQAVSRKELDPHPDNFTVDNTGQQANRPLEPEYVRHNPIAHTFQSHLD